MVRSQSSRPAVPRHLLAQLSRHTVYQVVLRGRDMWRLSKFRVSRSVPCTSAAVRERRGSRRARSGSPAGCGLRDGAARRTKCLNTSRFTFKLQPEPHRSLVCHVSPAVPVSLFRRARSDTPLRSPHRPHHLAKDGCRLRVVYRIHHIHRDLLGQVIGYLPVPAVRLSVCERPHESRSRARFCFTLLRLTTRLC
jgi:hypothetical protein